MSMIHRTIRIPERMDTQIREYVAQLQRIDRDGGWDDSSLIRFGIALGLMMTQEAIEHGQPPNLGPNTAAMIANAWHAYSLERLLLLLNNLGEGWTLDTDSHHNTARIEHEPTGMYIRISSNFGVSVKSTIKLANALVSRAAYLQDQGRKLTGLEALHAVGISQGPDGISVTVEQADPSAATRLYEQWMIQVLALLGRGWAMQHHKERAQVSFTSPEGVEVTISASVQWGPDDIPQLAKSIQIGAEQQAHRTAGMKPHPTVPNTMCVNQPPPTAHNWGPPMPNKTPWGEGRPLVTCGACGRQVVVGSLAHGRHDCEGPIGQR